MVVCSGWLLLSWVKVRSRVMRMLKSIDSVVIWSVIRLLVSIFGRVLNVEC